jgi:beta-lactamase class D
MIRLPFLQVLACLFCLFSYVNTLLAEENFVLIHGVSGKNIMELGPHTHQRITPCSTFKIALSLMGFNEGILQDEVTPTWFFQEGYEDFLKSWKLPQTPQSWMKTSCVWYSKVLVTQLGKENMQKYLSLFKYGNQDLSGGLTTAWIGSSLKISPREQVDFLQRMVQNTLPISSNAMQKTRDLLFVEELSDGWKLFGKTGWSGSILGQDGKNIEFGWFVGWIEKDAALFLFAYNICEGKIDLAQRIPRVKQLLKEALSASTL